LQPRGRMDCDDHHNAIVLNVRCALHIWKHTLGTQELSNSSG
jgi:hypothetical protein